MNINNGTPLINFQTGEYPVYFPSVRQATPNVSWPSNPAEELLWDYGFAAVQQTDQPTGDVVEEGTPALQPGDGTTHYYLQTWTVRAYTPEEAAAALASRKTALNFGVENLLANAIWQPVPYNFGGTDGVQHISTELIDRVNLQAQHGTAKTYVANNQGSTVMRIRTTEENTISMAATDYLVMAQAVSDYIQQYYDAAWSLKDQIKAAATLADLPTLPPALVVS